MINRHSILVVAATARELATPDGWRTLRCGVGPVDAAATTAAALATHKPGAILHVGIAGARRASALAPASLVIGGQSRYCDLAVSATWAPIVASPPEWLREAVERVLPLAAVLVIGTSARVGGTTDCDVEAMEGFAVLRAAQLAGIPAIEVRAIANDIEESDRTRWHFDRAFDAICAATPVLVAAIHEAMNTTIFADA